MVDVASERVLVNFGCLARSEAAVAELLCMVGAGGGCHRHCHLLRMGFLEVSGWPAL